MVGLPGGRRVGVSGGDKVRAGLGLAGRQMGTAHNWRGRHELDDPMREGGYALCPAWVRPCGWKYAVEAGR